MFTAKQRRIYHFEYNGKTVSRDPGRLLRRMDSTRPKDYGQLVEDLKSADRSRWNAAMEALAPWIQQLFGVQGIDDDGNGLTDDELFDLLADFNAWIAKKNDATPASPDSSAPIPDSTPSAAEGSPLPTNSDCGCAG